MRTELINGELKHRLAYAQGEPAGFVIENGCCPIADVLGVDEGAKLNAEFICRAVNCHTALVAAAQSLCEWHDANEPHGTLRDCVQIARLALAKAKGKI